MGRKAPRRFSIRKKTEPELEYEYEPPGQLGPVSDRERKLRAEILRRADDFSRRVGMDRREFMTSALGMATTLSVFNLASGCGDGSGFHTSQAATGFAEQSAVRESAASEGATSAEDSGSLGHDAEVDAGPRPRSSMDPKAGMAGDGGFQVSHDMCLDGELADRLFRKDYFILDMQTDHMPPGLIDLGEFKLCSNSSIGGTQSIYVTDLFLDSDTSVAVLAGNVLSNDDAVASRDTINRACAPGADRVLAQCQTDPLMSPDLNGPAMEKFSTLHGTRGFKCMPLVGSWFLTDPNGIALIEKAIELGDPLICAHKGYPLGPTWSRKHADPMPDVGAVAQRYPKANFVIYNSAGDRAHDEGPYDDNPDPQNGGVDRLAKAVKDAGLRMQNVYAEMGYIWWQVMRDPVQATHYLGKMLKYLGEERLVWGTATVWLGAPQCQIDALKAFKLDSGLREMHEYPDFTDDVRRKVFGLTAAKLCGIDPSACRYAPDQSKLAMRTQRTDSKFGGRHGARPSPPAIRSYRDLLALRKAWATKRRFA